MSDETSTPTPDDDQPAPAEALAAAMSQRPGLLHPEPVSPAELAALLAQPEPGTTIH